MTSPDFIGEALELFDAVVDLSPDDRQALLDERCAGDLTLRKRVESMLAAEDGALDTLDDKAQGVDARARAIMSELDISNSADQNVPQNIAGYRILRKLGEGGMGQVFEAEQDSPKRRVALKVIRTGYLSPNLVKRFDREAYVLGQLQHPGIAHIYESGVVEVDGHQQPYFAMELIEGERITVHVRNRGFTVLQRLELMARVCDAVQHAHQKAIIHRDLKPANILVIEQDTSTGTGSGTSHTGTTIDVIGQPKILDFGVARITEGDVQAVTLQTEVGQIVGTLNYMSPEQVAGDSSQLDTRCDVYALGVMLFELLTDRLPLDISGKSVAEAARIIQDEEPVRASTLDRILRGDVDTIIVKALEKNPDRRYASAAEFAADIRRYLQDEPIAARPASATYQLRKFARRNKGLVAGVVMTFIVLVTGLISTGYYLMEARTQRDNAITARDEADAARDDANQIAAFQATQLSGIDVPLMGERLRRSLRDAIPEEERALFNAHLAKINFTDVALESLEENIFARSVEAIGEQFGDQPLVKARLLRTVGDTCRDLGLMSFAERPLEDSVDVFRRNLGKDHPDTLTSINSLGEWLFDQGQFAAAEQLFREVLESRRRILGDDHPVTLSDLGNVGTTLLFQGKHNEAEPYLRDALEQRRRVLGDDSPEITDSLDAMGAFYRSQGKFAEAEPYLREALEIRRRTLNPNDPTLMLAISNLGAILFRQGKFDDAEPFFRQALESRRRVLGDNHPSTINSLNSMAALLSNQNRTNEAEALYRDALESGRRNLGDEHPQVLTMMHNLATLLVKKEMLDEAEEFFRKAITTRERVLGEKHPDTLLVMNHFADMLRKQKRFSEATPYYLAAAKGICGILGDNHPGVRTVMSKLVLVLDAQQRWAEAEQWLDVILELARKAEPTPGRAVASALEQLGRNLLAQKKFSEAEATLDKCLTIRRRILLENDGLIWHSQSLLAEAIASDLTRVDEAESVLCEAAEKLMSSDGVSGKHVVAAQSRLIKFYKTIGKLEEAAEWERKYAVTEAP